VATACGLNCDSCPAANPCGKVCNFCIAGHHRQHDSPVRCALCESNPLLRMEVRQAVIDHLGGLDFIWPRSVRHHEAGDLPLHLPVLVQAYADPIDLPWVALHAGRVFGLTGSAPTPKHRRPLRDVYRLTPATKLALEFYVEDRVLEGIWANRRSVIQALSGLAFDLILSPSFSVWYDHSRFEQLVQERRAFIVYHELLEAGLPAIPDIGWSLFEPDGRRWAEWINSQPHLGAVSLFCDGRKVHASRRALRETVEDIALFHRAVRPDVAFVLGGVHAPDRLASYRRVAPGRRLVICNGMAYALAQRRRLLGSHDRSIARSARECFLHNCADNDRIYAEILGVTENDVAV
jgi:Domain of unknown function (DUF4417)